MSKYKSYQSLNAEEGDPVNEYVWAYDREPEKIDPAAVVAQSSSSNIIKGKSQIEAVVYVIVMIAVISFWSVMESGFATIASQNAPSFPNIVFILTDDQGIGDMDFEGSDFNGLMPTIRALSTAGANLTNYYSISLCTPARSALLTGKYPISNGMHHGVITGSKTWGLPSTEVLLPQYLSTVGYSSHLVGKWHLGHYSTTQIPLRRGFSSFFGYYGGYQHPVNFLYEWPICVNQTACVPDMMNGDVPFESDGESFNTYLFMEEASRIIKNQKPGHPFFLLYSLPLMHMPVIVDEDVLDDYESELSHLTNSWRKKTGAMAIMLDLAVEHVIDALTEAKLLPNTIIVFASDNGAQVEGNLYGAGSNFPLRGSKGSLYEGGSRVPAFIFSPLLGHVLPPKILSGDDDINGEDDDGDKERVDDEENALIGRRLLRDAEQREKFNNFPLSGRRLGRRRRLLSTYNITDLGVQIPGLFHVSDWVPTLMAAIGRIDIIEGMPLDGINQWDYVLQSSLTDRESDDAELAHIPSPRTGFLYNADTLSGISAIRSNEWKLILNESEYASWFDGENFGEDYCGFDLSQTVQLFNLTSDPEERINLASDFPDIVAELRESILDFISNAAPVEFCSYSDSKAIQRWEEDGFVSPWVDGSSFDCPVETTTAGWCTLIDPELELDIPSSGEMGVPV